MENVENKNLQGRREFFKNAARKALPLFAVALIGPALFSSCTKEESHSCKDCSGSCKTGCSGDCYYGCTGDCDSGCNELCYKACKGKVQYN